MRISRRALMAAGLAAPGLARAQAPVAAASSQEEQRLRTDWAYLQRYAAANLVDRDLPPERRRAVFMGDSITSGWRDSHPSFFETNGFIGRGIGGQTTAQMLLRFWPDVIALRPRAVHILGGVNDIAQNAGPYDPAATKANLQAMTVLAQANGVAVVLATLTPVAEFPWRPGLGPTAKVAALNAWIRAYAVERGATLADYTAALEDGVGAMRPGLAYDGVHPTREGYALMEPIAMAALAERDPKAA
ncbi:SGNH/GDSL hydrolase family protein [Caulobacter sp. DWR2-3-1b2]|uniref:SGNH/GDSL hydrolase family protein n=1 Tax=unclassified Caulobacter TaxID=2648921 RepID=UPI003CED5BBB